MTQNKKGGKDLSVVWGVAASLGCLCVQAAEHRVSGSRHLPPRSWSRASHLYVEKEKDLTLPT